MTKANALNVDPTNNAAVVGNGTNFTTLGYTSSATASTLMSRDSNGNSAINNVIPGSATTATSGGTTFLSVTSAQIQYFTGSSNHTCRMPDTSTLINGQSYLLFNQSTGFVTVQTSGANFLAYLSPSSYATLRCFDTAASGAAAWSVAPIKNIESASIVYVSKYGNGVNSGRSVNEPVANFSTAFVRALGLSPSATNRVSIICLDDGIYSGGISIDAFMDIYAPNAVITNTSSPYCIIADNDTFVTVKELRNSSSSSAYAVNTFNVSGSQPYQWLNCESIRIGNAGFGYAAIENYGGTNCVVYARVNSIQSTYSPGNGDALACDATNTTYLTANTIDCKNVLYGGLTGKAVVNCNNCLAAVNPSLDLVVLASNLYGSWTPTLVGGTSAGTTTYVTQSGKYTMLGNTVTVDAVIEISGATGTGDVVIGGLPYAIGTSRYLTGALVFNGSGWTWPTGTTQLSLLGNNGTTVKIVGSGSAVAAANMQMTNAALTVKFSATYQLK